MDNVRLMLSFEELVGFMGTEEKEMEKEMARLREAETLSALFELERNFPTSRKGHFPSFLYLPFIMGTHSPLNNCFLDFLIQDKRKYHIISNS